MPSIFVCYNIYKPTCWQMFNGKIPKHSHKKEISTGQRSRKGRAEVSETFVLNVPSPWRWGSAGPTFVFAPATTAASTRRSRELVPSKRKYKCPELVQCANNLVSSIFSLSKDLQMPCVSFPASCSPNWKRLSSSLCRICCRSSLQV